MRKVAVGSVNAPVAVFIGLRYGAAHFIIKVDRKVAVAHDIVNVAVRGDLGICLIDLLIVKSKDAENPLKLYDEVILKADVYEEGKTVRN